MSDNQIHGYRILNHFSICRDPRKYRIQHDLMDINPTCSLFLPKSFAKCVRCKIREESKVSYLSDERNKADHVLQLAIGQHKTNIIGI